MSATVIVFLVLAIVLFLFGALFAFQGMSNEKAYWTQRDPSGYHKGEATSFGTVLKNPWRLAFSDDRAPLRVAAIGVVLWWLAIVCLVVAVLVWLL